MRPEFAEAIRCPACAADGPFIIDARLEDEHEIVEGELRCDACGIAVPIRQGFLDLLHQRSAEVLREQDAQARRENLPASSWPNDPADQRHYVL